MPRTEDFGLWSECPQASRFAWGCRAIDEDWGLDILPDRKSARGYDDPGYRHFRLLLEPVLERLDEYARKYLDEPDRVTLLFQGAGLTVKARRAGGYVYVIAYTLPLDALLDGAQWSGRGDHASIPRIGDEVGSRLGPGLVVSHYECDGWIGVGLSLFDPPEWFRCQNKGMALAGLFGAELC